ncbi:MAG: hypothetical protein M3323_10935 [Actinomycetota bacterium]|nr:hypothetical protein [Actinomycetota bacterium]
MSAEPRIHRHLVVLVAGLLAGSALASPSVAHVGRNAGHLWSEHVKPRLSAEGTINSPGNPVNWEQLKNVPSGIADGDDAVSDGSGQGGQRRTLLIPHVFETKGRVGQQENTLDTFVKAVYRRGKPLQGSAGGGATVHLYLYSDSGSPMEGGGATGATQPVCQPCSFPLDVDRPAATIGFDELIVARGGGFDNVVKLGFGVIVVDGPDPGGVALQGFVVNSHTGPFDISVFPLEEVEPEDVTT